MGLGPKILALTSAAKPPVMCTTPEPAKSMTPVRMTLSCRGRYGGDVGEMWARYGGDTGRWRP